jgi:hypothetical protein
LFFCDFQLIGIIGVATAFESKRKHKNARNTYAGVLQILFIENARLIAIFALEIGGAGP